MAITLQDAAELYRQALRSTVKKYAVLFISEGALLAIVGIFAIIYSLSLSSMLAAPLGWLLIVTAALQGLILFGMRSMPHFGFQLLSVVIALLVGFLLLRDPSQAQQTITVLVVMFLMMQGVARLVFGFAIRPFTQWQWVMASGALGIVLSLVLLSNLPDPPTWLIGLLVGIELIGDGVAIAFLAWSGGQQVAKGEMR